MLVEKMTRFSGLAAMLTAVFWAQQWLIGPYAAQASETWLWASFVFLVLASAVAILGVANTVPNRTLAVVILLIMIASIAVLVTATLAAYIVETVQHGVVENTLLEDIRYLGLLVYLLDIAAMGIVALGSRRWITGISLLVIAWPPLAPHFWGIPDESRLVVVGHGLAVLAWAVVGFRLWAMRKNTPDAALTA